jgi:hypothetical protein
MKTGMLNRKLMSKGVGRAVCRRECHNLKWMWKGAGRAACRRE